MNHLRLIVGHGSGSGCDTWAWGQEAFLRGQGWGGRASHPQGGVTQGPDTDLQESDLGENVEPRTGQEEKGEEAMPRESRKSPEAHGQSASINTRNPEQLRKAIHEKHTPAAPQPSPPNVCSRESLMVRGSDPHPTRWRHLGKPRDYQKLRRTLKSQNPPWLILD